VRQWVPADPSAHANLGYIRQFSLAYRDRIPHPPGGESLPTFHPDLSSSHYRARCVGLNLLHPDPHGHCRNSAIRPAGTNSTLSVRFRFPELLACPCRDRLGTDLRRDFLEMTGLSARNLKYMHAFAEAYTVQQVVARLLWAKVGSPGRIRAQSPERAMTSSSSPSRSWLNSQNMMPPR
jgi:hypothetical protein